MTGRAAVASALLLCVAGAASAADLLIRNARLIDGTGAPPRDHVSILVRDGRVRAIGSPLADDTTPALDADGATVLPGLVDAHAHFTAAPGSGFRHDAPATIDALNHHHLRAYLACGVTTVFDPGAQPDTVRAVQTWLAAGNPGPRYLTTGPTVTVPGGYPGVDHWGPVTTPAEVEAKLDQIQDLGGIGVKLGIETSGQGLGSRDYPPDIRDAIMRGAATRGLPLFVHATSETDQERALAMRPRAIVHAVMGGRWRGELFPRDLSAAFVARFAASGAYLVTTFSLIDTWPGAFPPERLDDPLLALTVPPLELATARDPAAWRYYVDAILGAAAPWLPAFARPFVAHVLWSAANLRAGLRYGQRNVKALHDAGVPIVVGTDAPSVWPIAYQHFHGAQTLREIALVGAAGLTPAEAIAAATRVPATMLGLAHEFGTIEVGKAADFVVVRDDPLRDLRALRTVRWTVREGVAHTPEEWMQEARR